MALSNDKSRTFGPTDPNKINNLPVKASSLIYAGSAVGEDGAGYHRALVAGDPFRGFADRSRADNSSGSAGAIMVAALGEGVLKNVSVTGASGVTDVGQLVYMSDDDTLTLTQGTNSLIGRIKRYDPTTSKFDVFFQSDLDASVA